MLAQRHGNFIPTLREREGEGERETKTGRGREKVRERERVREKERGGMEGEKYRVEVRNMREQ